MNMTTCPLIHIDQGMAVNNILKTDKNLLHPIAEKAGSGSRPRSRRRFAQFQSVIVNFKDYPFSGLVGGGENLGRGEVFKGNQ